MLKPSKMVQFKLTLASNVWLNTPFSSVVSPVALSVLFVLSMFPLYPAERSNVGRYPALARVALLCETRSWLRTICNEKLLMSPFSKHDFSV